MTLGFHFDYVVVQMFRIVQIVRDLIKQLAEARVPIDDQIFAALVDGCNILLATQEQMNMFDELTRKICV